MEEMNQKKELVPVCEKYTLSIKEAAAYFNIGIKKMRRLAEMNTGRFAVVSGNKFLIIRPKFEKFLDDSLAGLGNDICLFYLPKVVDK